MKASVFFIVAALFTAITTNAKTLVVYYSFTNNVHTIVSDLRTQIDADVIRIEPAEKGIDYAANNYAAGSALISAIRNNPDDAATYPAIDPVKCNLSDYDTVIVAAPLWWSNMAAPLQTFLFQYGKQMAGKKIGLIVSSASSGISNVVADAKRLIPQGAFLEPNLWIRSAQTSNCHSLIEGWLNDIDYSHIVTSTATIHETMGTTVNMTTHGVQVVGEFEELAIFTMNGQKILGTSASYTSFPFQVGCYIAQLRKGGMTYSMKEIVK